MKNMAPTEIGQLTKMLAKCMTHFAGFFLACIRVNDITVEQENFATGNFRDFRPQAIRVQEIFANFWLRDLPSFKYSKTEIFMNTKISRI